MARAIDGTWNGFLLNLSYLTLKDFQENKAGLNTLKTAVESQPTLTPPNEWVSVEERLPEARDDYMVLTEDAEVFLCDYIPSVRQWWNGDSIIIDGRITHWMPLPALPDRRQPEG